MNQIEKELLENLEKLTKASQKTLFSIQELNECVGVVKRSVINRDEINELNSDTNETDPDSWKTARQINSNQDDVLIYQRLMKAFGYVEGTNLWMALKKKEEQQ